MCKHLISPAIYKSFIHFIVVVFKFCLKTVVLCVISLMHFLAINMICIKKLLIKIICFSGEERQLCTCMIARYV